MPVYLTMTLIYFIPEIYIVIIVVTLSIHFMLCSDEYRIQQSINFIGLTVWALLCASLLYIYLPIGTTQGILGLVWGGQLHTTEIMSLTGVAGVETMASEAITGTKTQLTVLSPILPDNIIIANGLVLINSGINLVKILLVLTTCIIIKLSQSYFIKQEFYKQGKNNIELGAILIVLGTLGMCLLVSSADLISAYLALELQSLSLYVLASLKREGEKSTEAGLKYFILGALASGFFLFGCTFIYGSLGSTYFELFTLAPSHISNMGVIEGDIIGGVEQNKGILIGLTLILIAFLFKISAAPFHM